MSNAHGPSLGPFQWDDPLLLESQLTEDERLIRDSARAFAASELAPRIEKAYLDETTDPSLFRAMGQAGLLGVTLPEDYGCADAGYVSLRTGRARGRAHRQRLPLDDERAELARDVSDLRLWRRGPAAQISARTGDAAS